MSPYAEKRLKRKLCRLEGEVQAIKDRLGYGSAGTIEIIKDEVAKWFKLKPHVIYSRLRPEHIVWPRQVAMALSVELSGLSCVYVARYFRRDHGTLCHAMKRMSARCDTEPSVKQSIEGLRQCILEAVKA
jgi:chromosomal replication initiation ATPase DnaA